MEAIPSLVHALLVLQKVSKASMALVEVPSLMEQLSADSARPILHGAGRAMAIGAAFEHSRQAVQAAESMVAMLGSLMSASIIEWRVVGLQALRLTLPCLSHTRDADVICLQHVVSAIVTGLNDYTITERGDVGSLVRLQAINLIDDMWQQKTLKKDGSDEQLIIANLMRLSLEKLDRVRLHAALCLQTRYAPGAAPLFDVSSHAYFREKLSVLKLGGSLMWQLKATIKGCISTGGSGNESLLQPVRAAVSEALCSASSDAVTNFMNILTSILKEQLAESADTQPALEFLAYILHDLPMQTLVDQAFNWRNLLAYVQKTHYKSSVVPKILAAVDTYRGLAYVTVVRDEVVRKLLSMLKTNPYASVRIAVAECLWCITAAEILKPVDWSRSPKELLQTVSKFQDVLISKTSS